MRFIKIFSGFALMLTIASVNDLVAQAFNDANHTRVKLTKYEDVDGNPFLVDNWSKGDVKLANGSSFKNLLLKYNQEEDQIYFRGNDDSDVQVFVDQVKSFDIAYQVNNTEYIAHYNSGYKDIPGTTTDSYFEVLADGKVQFIKKSSKTIEEHKEYSSSVISKKIVNNTKYFILYNGNASQIKLNNKSVLAVLDTPEAKDYVSKNSLNLKLESDVIKLVGYISTL